MDVSKRRSDKPCSTPSYGDDRLENALRNFSTLTLGDTIQINYNDKVYEIMVLNVKPHFEEHAGISIVETDLEVDFAPPVGYVEPSRPVSTPSSMVSVEFSGL